MDPRGNLKSTARPTAPKLGRSKSKRAASARHQPPCTRDRKRHGGRNDAYFAIPRALVAAYRASVFGHPRDPRSQCRWGHKEGPGLPEGRGLRALEVSCLTFPKPATLQLGSSALAIRAPRGRGASLMNDHFLRRGPLLVNPLHLLAKDAPASHHFFAEVPVMGRAKFSCACGTPRSARQADDLQI
jgi:hypothetical protein